MAGITASGLGSGIDIKSLASQLVAAERGPATSRLDSRESKLKAQISAFGSFKSVLANLQSALTSLKKTDTFQSLKATVADDKLLTATASNGAQLGEYAITVNTVCPGAIETETTMPGGALHEALKDIRKQQINHTALRRVGTMDDVAGVIAFLVSDDAAFVTGQAISVDGGSKDFLSRSG